MLTESISQAPSKQIVRVEIELTKVEAMTLADMTDKAQMRTNGRDPSRRRLMEKLNKAANEAVRAA